MCADFAAHGELDRNHRHRISHVKVDLFCRVVLEETAEPQQALGLRLGHEVLCIIDQLMRLDSLDEENANSVTGMTKEAFVVLLDLEDV